MTLEELALKVADLTAKYHQLETEIQANTAMTQRVKIDTAKLVEWTEAMEGATKFFSWLEKLGKPIWFLIKWVAIIGVSWQTGKELIRAYFKSIP